MKALNREQSTDAVALLTRMAKMVRNYSVTHAIGSKAPPQARLHDSLALAEATKAAEEFVNALDDTPARIEYQLQVVGFLRSMAMTNIRHEEEPELVEAYETARPWQDFAQSIMNQRTLERIDSIEASASESPSLKSEADNGVESRTT